MSIRNLMLKKRCCGHEKEEDVMEAKNKNAEIKEESNVLENLKKIVMKNISFIFCFLLLSFSADASQQISELANNLVELGRFYRYNGFENESAEKIKRHLKPLRTPELNATTDFVAQLVKKNNRLMHKKYLQLPNDETLVYVFIMRKVAFNLWKKEPALILL